jgi:hypothetical protein
VETFVFIVATITVTLPWKRPKLTVMQQALSRYYENATRCTDHVTTGNLICHSIVLHGGIYVDLVIDRYEGPQTAFTVALPGGLYIALIMDSYGGSPYCSYHSLAWSLLHSHYNGAL